MIQEMLNLYQSRCNYTITDNIQLLNFDIDIKRLKHEILSFLIKNDYGLNIVSLRLPPGQTNYLDKNELLEETATPYYHHIFDNNLNPNVLLPKNYRSNAEYLEWHPDLINSYTASLVSELELLTGFNIGRVRLGWLRPNTGYRIHRDLEPMRLHIPIVTNDVAYFIHEHKLYHMEYGKLYHLMTTGLHTAFNFGMLPRLHLVFSTYSDEEVSNKIESLSSHQNLEQNFIDHISKSIDQETLSMLYDLSIKNINPSERSELVEGVKKIQELLS